MHFSLLRKANLLGTAFCISQAASYHKSKANLKYVPLGRCALGKQGKIFYERPSLFPHPGLALSRHLGQAALLQKAL